MLDLSGGGGGGRQHHSLDVENALREQSASDKSSAPAGGLMGYDWIETAKATDASDGAGHFLDIDVSSIEHSMPVPSSLPVFSFFSVPRFLAQQMFGHPLESAAMVVAVYFTLRTLPNEVHIVRGGVCASVTDQWSRVIGWLLAAAAVSAAMFLPFVILVRFTMYRATLKFRVVRSLGLAMMARMEVGMRGVQACMLGSVAFGASLTALWWPDSTTATLVCVNSQRSSAAASCTDCSHAWLWLVALPLSAVVLNNPYFLCDPKESISLGKLLTERETARKAAKSKHGGG